MCLNKKPYIFFRGVRPRAWENLLLYIYCSLLHFFYTFSLPQMLPLVVVLFYAPFQILYIFIYLFLFIFFYFFEGFCCILYINIFILIFSLWILECVRVYVDVVAVVFVMLCSCKLIFWLFFILQQKVLSL